MAFTAGVRPQFDPVDTSFDASERSRVDDVESPSLSSSNALARFEFEPGRSKDGTKVLMVEWEDDEATRSITGDWEVRWEGKRTVLPAKDQAREGEGEAPVNRLYFLLGPGIAIPTAVQLRKGSVTWRTNPLPAIFSPDLGATARQEGKKGVLHTIWAKKRLQVLQSEIDAETKLNAEGIGLEMATAERDWIEQNFGVLARPAGLSISTTHPATPSGLNSPTTPRSSTNGRLMEKLKGLGLRTSNHELSAARQNSSLENPVLQPASATTNGSSAYPQHNPLSPDASDVAVTSFSSFAALKGLPPPSTLAAKPPQQRFVAQKPPDALAARQQQRQPAGNSGMASLNAFAAGEVGGGSGAAQEGAAEDEDELFALPMSPRSPDMAKSPFSFGEGDTVRYVK